MVNLERIHKDFARITSENVDPGEGVDRWSTWKGSSKTLEGLPLTMLILGGQSMVNLERICKEFVMEGLPLTMLILGGQLMVNLERIHNDFGRITSDNVDPGGVD